MGSDESVAVEIPVASVAGHAVQYTGDAVAGAGASTLDVRFVQVDGREVVRVTIPHMLGFRSSVFEAPASSWPFVLRPEGS